MKKLWIATMVFATLGVAQATLLAEYTFDTDTTDTAGGHHGILSVSNATVTGGELVLGIGGYMDLGATFGAVSPLGHTTSDFSIELDFKMPAGGTILSSSRVADLTTQQSLHPLSIHTNSRRGTNRIWYDKYYAGDPRIGAAAGTANDVLDNTYRTLLVTYEAATKTINLTCGGLAITDWGFGIDPATADIHLDTVRIGGTLNTGATYGQPGSVNGLTVDNVRIYNEIIPEPATLGMFGMGGLIALFIRRRLVK